MVCPRVVQAWTNGRFSSVLHRAMVNEKTERLSIVFPFSPAADYDICIPPSLIDEAHPLRYPAPIEWHHLAVIRGNHVAKEALSANFGLKTWHCVHYCSFQPLHYTIHTTHFTQLYTVLCIVSRHSSQKKQRDYYWLASVDHGISKEQFEDRYAWRSSQTSIGQGNHGLGEEDEMAWRQLTYWYCSLPMTYSSLTHIMTKNVTCNVTLYG